MLWYFYVHISCRFTLLLLYTVCVVKQGQSLYNGVLLFFFLFFNSIQKGWEKNIHDVSGSISVEKPKPVAFLCCELNFYFHIHLWFLQALKQHNKKNLLKCTIGFTFQFQSNVAVVIKLRCQYQAQRLTCFLAHLSPCTLHWKGHLQNLQSVEWVQAWSREPTWSKHIYTLITAICSLISTVSWWLISVAVFTLILTKDMKKLVFLSLWVFFFSFFVC